MPIRSYRDLRIWSEAHSLTLEVYRQSGRFPDSERFGIVSQLRRAAASVPANIAEGTGRRTTRDLLHFLFIARGSIQEVRYFLLLSRDLHYLDDRTWNEMERRYRGLEVGLNAGMHRLNEKAAPK